MSQASMSIETIASPGASSDASAPGGVSSDARPAAGVTGESIKTLLQSAGYRAEMQMDNGLTVLRSATGGLPFEIRFGNRVAGSPGHYLDATFVAILAIKGTLPDHLLNEWNRSRRFARLFIDRPLPEQPFLVLCMDVVFADTPAQRSFMAHVEVWDALVQQLIGWLRETLNSQPNGAQSTASPTDGM